MKSSNKLNIWQTPKDLLKAKVLLPGPWLVCYLSSASELNTNTDILWAILMFTIITNSDRCIPDTWLQYQGFHSSRKKVNKWIKKEMTGHFWLALFWPKKNKKLQWSGIIKQLKTPQLRKRKTLQPNTSENTHKLTDTLTATYLTRRTHTPVLVSQVSLLSATTFALSLVLHHGNDKQGGVVGVRLVIRATATPALPALPNHPQHLPYSVPPSTWRASHLSPTHLATPLTHTPPSRRRYQVWRDGHWCRV